jgi:hypothetical protein
MIARSTIVASFLMMAAATVASAQQAQFEKHELVVSSGPIWAGGYAIGESLAQLRSNANGSQPSPFLLFAVSSSMEQLLGIEGNVGYAITPWLIVEGGGWYARANIAVDLSRDPEAQPTSIDGEKLHQVIVSGGVAWRLPVSLGRKVAPFLTAGGGYLRQLHEERTLAESGRIYYVGGGARYFLSGGTGSARSVGIRGDVRLNWRTPGIDFESKTRKFPTLTLQLFVGL